MKVLGIGLPRTGNTSLAKFLESRGLVVAQYGVAKSCYRECDAMVDFPMPIMFPWLMNTCRELRAILTYREDLTGLYDSTMNFITHLVETSSTDRIRELFNVTRMLYGREIPTRTDIINASDRVEMAAAPFVREGRVLRLSVQHPDKARLVCDFLGLPDTGIEYPHEGSIKT